MIPTYSRVVRKTQPSRNCHAWSCRIFISRFPPSFFHFISYFTIAERNLKDDYLKKRYLKFQFPVGKSEYTYLWFIYRFTSLKFHTLLSVFITKFVNSDSIRQLHKNNIIILLYSIVRALLIIKGEIIIPDKSRSSSC